VSSRHDQQQHVLHASFFWVRLCLGPFVRPHWPGQARCSCTVSYAQHEMAATLRQDSNAALSSASRESLFGCVTISVWCVCYVCVLCVCVLCAVCHQMQDMIKGAHGLTGWNLESHTRGMEALRCYTSTGDCRHAALVNFFQPGALNTQGPCDGGCDNCKRRCVAVRSVCEGAGSRVCLTMSIGIRQTFMTVQQHLEGLLTSKTWPCTAQGTCVCVCVRACVCACVCVRACARVDRRAVGVLPLLNDCLTWCHVCVCVSTAVLQAVCCSWC
jgi:hypothetical protein